MDAKAKKWFLLFKEKLERPLDANKKENLVREQVLGERKGTAIRQLKGGVLFDELETKIREGVLNVLQAPTSLGCGCQTCNMVRAINTLIALWIDLERIAEKGDD